MLLESGQGKAKLALRGCLGSPGRDELEQVELGWNGMEWREMPEDRGLSGSSYISAPLRLPTPALKHSLRLDLGSALT